MTKSKRLYYLRLILGSVAYLLLLPLCINMMKALPEDNLLRYVVILIPVLPIGFVFWAMIKWVQGLDEMQQRIQLEAAVFSLGVTGMLFFALGLLERAGLETLNMVWVLPMIIVFWGFGQIIARRRYE